MRDERISLLLTANSTWTPNYASCARARGRRDESTHSSRNSRQLFSRQITYSAQYIVVLDYGGRVYASKQQGRIDLQVYCATTVQIAHTTYKESQTCKWLET